MRHVIELPDANGQGEPPEGWPFPTSVPFKLWLETKVASCDLIDCGGKAVAHDGPFMVRLANDQNACGVIPINMEGQLDVREGERVWVVTHGPVTMRQA